MNIVSIPLQLVCILLHEQNIQALCFQDQKRLEHTIIVPGTIMIHCAVIYISVATVPTAVMSFSSYAGLLSSWDDFYIMDRYRHTVERVVFGG